MGVYTSSQWATCDADGGDYECGDGGDNDGDDDGDVGHGDDFDDVDDDEDDGEVWAYWSPTPNTATHTNFQHRYLVPTHPLLASIPVLKKLTTVKARAASLT